MPTPFTHLLMSDRLLADDALPAAIQQLISANRSAFLLGGIVADAHPEGVERADTHFYHYTRPMPDHPWREMFRQHPGLNSSKSAAHHAFLAGYVAHLAADEYWSRNLLRPHIAQAEWGDDLYDRFFVLHLLLIHMDERDESRLNGSIYDMLRQGQPNGWLPFLTDEAICEWRDFIADQLVGKSQTLAIFGGRIKREPEALREMLDDPAFMQDRLWANIEPALLAHIEDAMYDFSRQQMAIYYADFE